MYQSRTSRFNRKNQIVINLIQTPTGYSVIEGQNLVNKSANVALVLPTKQRNTHQIAKRQAIVVPLYPYVNTKKIDQQNKYTTIPSCAGWFSINAVHQIEKKSLSEWFKNKKSIGSKTEKYEKNEQLYKKYRNHIIQISKQGYVSPTKARKGLAGDACSIMRIHSFLQHWGIINYLYQVYPQRQLITKFGQQQKVDIFDYDKKLITKSYNNQDTQTLRIATKNYRPKCDYCRQRSGIVWFQYRKFKKTEKTQKLGGENQDKILVEGIKKANLPEYEIILCTKCFLQNNFPLVLTPSDFTKKTIQDLLGELKIKYKNQNHEELEWTNYQTNQLIDLLHKYGYHWKSITKQLKNRNVQEVLRHFLNLPLKQTARLRLSEPQTTDQQSQKQQQINQASTNIGQITTINQQVMIANPVQKHHKINKVYYDQEQEKKQRTLCQTALKLSLKKIEIKLDQLQEWQSSIMKIKKQVEQGRKCVIAQKIRGNYK